MVADSRDVALNHTAGLSMPQQVQMALFSLFALLDDDDAYTSAAATSCTSVSRSSLEGLGIELPDDPLRVGYYADLDLEAWGRKHVGDDFVVTSRSTVDPLDVVIDARASATAPCCSTAAASHGPPWSVRVSLANLDADAYATIGRHLATVLRNAIARRRVATVMHRLRRASSGLWRPRRTGSNVMNTNGVAAHLAGAAVAMEPWLSRPLARHRRGWRAERVRRRQAARS